MVKVQDVLDCLGIEHVFLTGPRNEFCGLLEVWVTGSSWVVAAGGP
jgi:hypothetical protein